MPPSTFSLKMRDFKSLFFDRPRILRAIDNATRVSLSRLGAFIMRRSRDSIRYVQRPSAPGAPPHGHRSMTFVRKSSRSGVSRPTSPLKEGILFGYDEGRRSVVVGVFKLNKPGRAPAALEWGGGSTFIDKGGRRHAYLREHPRLRRGFIRARPYLRPARDAELPKLGPMWAAALRW